MQNSNDDSKYLAVGKYLPHNFLAEKIILSSLLVNSQALDIVLRNVKVETFYFKNHQELYRNIIEMHQSKIPIDIITLNTFLQDNGQLEKIGGIKVLVELVNSVPNLTKLIYSSK